MAQTKPKYCKGGSISKRKGLSGNYEYGGFLSQDGDKPPKMKKKKNYTIVKDPSTGSRYYLRKPVEEKINDKKLMKDLQASIDEELYWLGAEQQYQQKEPGMFEVKQPKEYGWGGVADDALEWGVTGASIGTSIAPGWGTVIGGVVGAVGGGIYGYIEDDQAQMANKAQENKAKLQALNSAPIENERKKRFNAARMYAMGGNVLPEEEYSGASHNSPTGGIPIDSTGNPAAKSMQPVVGYTEGGEVMWNSYIFSDKKELAKASGNKKTFANRAKTIMEKYKGFSDKMSQDEKNTVLAQLQQEQEAVRESLGLSEPKEKLAYGGGVNPKYYREEELYPSIIDNVITSPSFYMTGLENTLEGLAPRTNYKNLSVREDLLNKDLMKLTSEYRDSELNPIISHSVGKDPKIKFDQKSNRYVIDSTPGLENLELRNEYSDLTTPTFETPKEKSGFASGAAEYAGPILTGLAGVSDIIRSTQKPRGMNASAYMVQPNVKPSVFSNQELRRDIEGQTAAARYLTAGQSPTLRMASNIALSDTANRTLAGATEAIRNANEQERFRADMANKEIESQNARYRFMVDDSNLAAEAAKEQLLDRGLDTLAGAGTLLTMQQLYDKRIKGDRKYIQDQYKDEISTLLGDTATDVAGSVKTPDEVGSLFSMSEEPKEKIDISLKLKDRSIGDFDFSGKSISSVAYNSLPKLDSKNISGDVALIDKTNKFTDYNRKELFNNKAELPSYEEWNQSTGKDMEAWKKEVLYPAVIETAQYYGIEPGLMSKMIAVESRGNPKAIGPETKYGKAKGLAQFIDSTAKQVGIEDPFNPKESVDGMARYLKWIDGMYKSYGNSMKSVSPEAYAQWEESGKTIHPAYLAAAYNWGIGNSQKMFLDFFKEGYRPNNPETPSLIYNKLKGKNDETANYINYIFNIE